MRLSNDGKIFFKVYKREIVDGFYQIPVGVTSIGEKAFAARNNLQTIALPVGLTTIEDMAFVFCTSLQGVIVPAGVTDIGRDAFRMCNSLQTITLPTGLVSIGSEAFAVCSSLKTVTIPDGVVIGGAAFRECSSLQMITLPADLTNINFCTFIGCSSLEAITLPAALVSIGSSAFAWCSSLKAVTIPAGVTNIDSAAFLHCTNLQTITLPAGVKTISCDAFNGCIKLTWIIIDSVDEAELKRITALLPEGLKNKVISKILYDELIQLQEKQLARILFSPQTNQIYRFFHVDTRYVSKLGVENEEKQVTEKTCTTLPEEIFCHINVHGADANRYYHKAKVLIEREPCPKTHEELKGYEARLIDIVTKCIEQAAHFQAATEEAQIAPPAVPVN